MNDFSQRLRLVTSRQNSLVKELRRAFHDPDSDPGALCAIEGVRILEEAIRSGLRFRAVFFSESARDRCARLLPQIAAQTETLLLPDDVFQSAVLTGTPQGVAALTKLKPFTLASMLGSPAPLILGAAGLQDPGNLGTIIRSAEAFGASGVIAAANTVIPWSPKVIRASAGSMFRLSVVKTDTASAVAEFRARGLKIWATSSHKGEPLHRVDLRGPVAVFVGGEGAGVSRELIASADGVLAVPHAPQVESLNAGIAASVILYEAARQRNS